MYVLFECGGFLPELGDYVDRGKQSLKTITLMFAYKTKFPENFFLLRGNHECASITRIYGFYNECKRRGRDGREGVCVVLGAAAVGLKERGGGAG